MVRAITLQAKPAKPAIGEIQMYFLPEPALGADAEPTISIRIISSGSIEGRPSRYRTAGDASAVRTGRRTGESSEADGLMAT